MIDLARKEESRHCIECFRCVNPRAAGGLQLGFRRPGAEVESIRNHHPDRWEVWFFFLATGLALGGFLWLVLPIYQEVRQAIGEWFILRDYYWIGEPGPAWLMSVHPERREVFRWLDFLLISSFMLGFMLAFAAALSATTAAAAWLAGRLGGDGDFKRRFVELGYQYAPIAMVSLIIGVGAELFGGLRYLNLSAADVGLVKGVVFAIGFGWSLWLGNRILAGQGLEASRRWGPLVPGLAGAALVSLAWWPALFGA
jgi:hypothetical protein